MGLFDRFYYGKAGKADYSLNDMPKTRVALFFMVLKDHIFDLIKTNLLQIGFWVPFLVWTTMNVLVILQMEEPQIVENVEGYVIIWLIGLIPCIAITGPSSAGTAYVMRNWAKDKHAFIFSDYKDAFKANWKQAILVSTGSAVSPLIIYITLSFYFKALGNSSLMVIPMACVIIMAVMALLMLVLLYPMMVGYELKTRYLFKNAVLMSLAKFPHLLIARVITFLPIAILIMGMFYGNAAVVMVILLYYVLFGFSFSRLLYASFSNAVFDLFLNPQIEGAAVREGLRPDVDEEIDPEDTQEVE